MAEEKRIDLINSKYMREFYKKMVYDFSFLNQFGFYYRTFLFHWVTPAVYFDNEEKKLEFCICFSSDEGEDRFVISLSKTTPVPRTFSNGKTSVILSTYPTIIDDLCKNDLLDLMQKGPDKGYELQYPIVKKKLIEYLNELKKKGIV